jgi:hypothetical protein
VVKPVSKPKAAVKVNTQEKAIGNIVLNIIEDWVQSGQATTTVRSNSYHNSFYKGDGVYTTDGGNLVNITYKGLVKLQGDKVVGNNVSYTKDEFAKAEGFGTWLNFEKDAKYAGKTLINGGSVHLYNITPATKKEVINKPTSAPVHTNSKVVEGDIFSIPGIPVITTNLGGVHGAGLAQLANAKNLIKKGDGAYKATDKVVQLPVKKVWSDNMAMNNNMELLKDSLRKLIVTARNNPGKTYLLPLAGLGHGEGSVKEIMPFLISTVQASPNIKLVLPAENVGLGRQGTVRQDKTREKLPEIKKMLADAGLLNQSSSQADADILASAAYKTWAAVNANPLMSDQENLDYYKKCKF